MNPNRTSVDSFRGVGLDEGVEIFKELSKDFLITTDVHETHQVDKMQEVVDIIQILFYVDKPICYSQVKLKKLLVSKNFNYYHSRHD